MRKVVVGITFDLGVLSMDDVLSMVKSWAMAAQAKAQQEEEDVKFTVSIEDQVWGKPAGAISGEYFSEAVRQRLGWGDKNDG